MAIVHQPQGKEKRKRLALGVKANREAITGKLALYETYEQLGLEDQAHDLLSRIQRLRAYLRAKTGDTE